jgi:hypothetical protein
MAWFKIFPDNRIDDEILELYYNIEILLKEDIKAIQDYLQFMKTSPRYQVSVKNKKYYAAEDIIIFLNQMNEDYGRCYSMRQYKTQYDFQTSYPKSKEKKQIREYLNKILKILIMISEQIKEIDKSNIEKNIFIEPLNKINELVINEKLFEKTNKENEEIILNILSKIFEESEENEKNGLWLTSNIRNGINYRLRFSQKLSIEEIRYLELIPVLNTKELDKKSLIIKRVDNRQISINKMHKDRITPILHYNIRINNKNIHVFPKNYADKIKPYLIIDKSSLTDFEIEENNRLDS